VAVTISYSWQSDTPSETNHRFIKEAIEAPAKLIVADGHVEQAPRLDHDRKLLRYRSLQGLKEVRKRK
jgi:hypothetical protein